MEDPRVTRARNVADGRCSTEIVQDAVAAYNELRGRASADAAGFREAVLALARVAESVGIENADSCGALADHIIEKIDALRADS